MACPFSLCAASPWPCWLPQERCYAKGQAALARHPKPLSGSGQGQGRGRPDDNTGGRNRAGRQRVAEELAR